MFETAIELCVTHEGGGGTHLSLATQQYMCSSIWGYIHYMSLVEPLQTTCSRPVPRQSLAANVSRSLL